jgi:transposase InsO family protein
VKRPFHQILGVDVMDLPVTQQGNKHVVVFQDYLTKWPMVFLVPDQRSQRLARLLPEEVVPMFGVLECLLSDRGANLLSHLMMDLCELLGIRKLNTTSYHPQCNGMVERFNRTLKTMLRKHAGRFSCWGWTAGHRPKLLSSLQAHWSRALWRHIGKS